MSEFDNVDKPRHYNAHPSGIQPIEIAEHMTLCLGTAFIYGWRYNMKGTPLEDLRKMRWFMLRQKDHAAYRPTVSRPVLPFDFADGIMEPRKHVFNRPSPWCEPVRHALSALCDWHRALSDEECDRLLDRAIKCIETAIADESCIDGRGQQP